MSLKKHLLLFLKKIIKRYGNCGSNQVELIIFCLHSSGTWLLILQNIETDLIGIYLL